MISNSAPKEPRIESLQALTMREEAALEKPRARDCPRGDCGSAAGVGFHDARRCSTPTFYPKVSCTLVGAAVRRLSADAKVRERAGARKDRSSGQRSIERATTGPSCQRHCQPSPRVHRRRGSHGRTGHNGPTRPTRQLRTGDARPVKAQQCMRLDLRPDDNGNTRVVGGGPCLPRIDHSQTTPSARWSPVPAEGSAARSPCQLAGRGCSVAVLDINAAGAEETAAICRKSGGEAEAIVDDLTREGAPEAAVDKVVERWGGIDILVNNAGYGGDRAVPRHDPRRGRGRWRSTSRRSPGLHGGRPGDARPAVRPHRQHHLAGLAHGAAELHRLRREQGGGRFDHPRRRGGAGAVRRAASTASRPA